MGLVGEQTSDQTLLLFTGAVDLTELGAILLCKLDETMTSDWADSPRRPGYLLPQLRLVLHAGFGEYDGLSIASPSLVRTVKAHARSTALNDAYAGDAAGVVVLATNEAYDADVYARHCPTGRQWIPFSQFVDGASPLSFWSRAALGAGG
ncbi:hypothetical protein [Streptomyces sp. RKAG337]|uniref:hypothetical protein n=1 Tax=Streptomyces sp. RKAG337 TaxID=2893404 RepID=UPI0020346B61|nr:hypothetical protein [Streptomyces sp. RKAG337]MCM2425020.1 hypothetical protein [Streptomyces sp. RKAG337]